MHTQKFLRYLTKIKAWLLQLLHRVRISLKTLKLREKENPNSFSRLVLKWFFVQ